MIGVIAVARLLQRRVFVGLWRATHMLRLSSRFVLEIALDCGFENPAQFHRIFKAEFGTSPGRYRRSGLV